MEYFDKQEVRKTIEKTKLLKTFRTITGVRNYDISDLYDYYIAERNTPKDFSHLHIPNRFRLNSDQTFVTSVYSEEKILPTNSFIMYFSPEKESKILCLYFNSIFYLVQFIGLAKQSTGKYLEIKQIDLKQIIVPDLTKIDKELLEKLLEYFDKNRHGNLIDIKTKLKNKPQEIDKLFVKALSLNISDKELRSCERNRCYEHLISGY